MASFVKYQDFIETLGKGAHNLHTDTLKIMLSNAAPNVATHTVRADAGEIAAGQGYTSGGEDTQNTYTESGGTGSCIGVDVTWTATGGSITTFRYVILYNDTHASDALIGYWDYGSSISPATGETFTTDFGSSMFTIA